MGKFTKGFLLGAIIGGTYALLHAKRPGHETREQLQERYADFKHSATSVGDAVKSLKQNTQTLQQAGLQSLQAFQKEMATVVRHFKENNGPLINRAKDRLNVLTSRLKSSDNTEA